MKLKLETRQTFPEDNDPKNTAKITQEALACHSQSPDLNPIENV